MKNKYKASKGRILTDHEGKLLDIVPVIKTLHKLEIDIQNNPNQRYHVFRHNGWSAGDSNDLYITATDASYYFGRRIHPEFNPELVELASERSILGEFQSSKWDHDLYDRIIIEELENIGLTYQLTSNKKDALWSIGIEGIPLPFPKKTLSKSELELARSTNYRIIHSELLVRDAVRNHKFGKLDKKRRSRILKGYELFKDETAKLNFY